MISNFKLLFRIKLNFFFNNITPSQKKISKRSCKQHYVKSTMQALCSANISPSHLTLNDKQEIPKVSRLKINKMQDLLQRYSRTTCCLNNKTNFFWRRLLTIYWDIKKVAEEVGYLHFICSKGEGFLLIKQRRITRIRQNAPDNSNST